MGLNGLVDEDAGRRDVAPKNAAGCAPSPRASWNNTDHVVEQGRTVAYMMRAIIEWDWLEAVFSCEPRTQEVTDGGETKKTSPAIKGTQQDEHNASDETKGKQDSH
eukprot:scaffold288384_cov18-Prasinocladus_malaysianus.AAC.1